jgi:hypothetical protein
MAPLFHLCEHQAGNVSCTLQQIGPQVGPPTTSSPRIPNASTEGFAAASHQRYIPKLSVILSEAVSAGSPTIQTSAHLIAQLNDTLDDKMCPNAGSSDPQTALWQSVYAPPITNRLNKAAPGANVTDDDIFNLISMCPFETLYTGSVSPFCHLFSAQDFQAFGYAGDLDKFYGTGLVLY